jgi:predicted amino acid racemase
MAYIAGIERNIVIEKLKSLLISNGIDLNGTGVSFNEYGFVVPKEYNSTKLMAMLREHATVHVTSDSWGSDINLVTLSI